MALTQIDDRGLKTPIDLLDNEKIQFGTGNDLKIFHNATNSEIKNATGTLYLESDDTWITDKEGSDKMAKFLHDGAVELYYDNAKKFETTSAGATLSGHLQLDGHLDMSDDHYIKLGTGDDLQIYHTGSQSRIENSGTGELRIQADDIQITDKEANDFHIKCVHDGAVELYYDNSKKFETTSTGITVSGDVKVGGNRFYSGAADEMDIYNNGTDSKIRSNGDPLKLEADSIILKANGNSDVALTTAINGAVELYHDNDLRFYTTTYGTILRGKEGYQAEVHIYGDEGDDNADKWQLHVGDAGFNILNYASGSWETNLECHGDGAVDLYYNNTKRLETTNNGAKLTAGNDSYGLWVDCNDTSYTSVVLNVECDRNTTDETYSHIGCHRSGAASVFFVRDSGNVENVNNSYGSTSDERLKENIVDAGSQWDDIKNLKVRKFNFKETTDPDKKTMIGLVAQEAEKVSPGLVSESKSMQGGVEGTYKTVKYSILYMKAIKALQEAITKIETLETKVAALEAE